MEKMKKRTEILSDETREIKSVSRKRQRKNMHDFDYKRKHFLCATPNQRWHKQISCTQLERNVGCKIYNDNNSHSNILQLDQIDQCNRNCVVSILKGSRFNLANEALKAIARIRTSIASYSPNPTRICSKSHRKREISEQSGE